MVHLAARAGVGPSIPDPMLYADVNLMSTARLLEFARSRGIAPFGFASSSFVYGNNEKVPFSEADPVDHLISDGVGRFADWYLAEGAAQHGVR